MMLMMVLLVLIWAVPVLLLCPVLALRPLCLHVNAMPVVGVLAFRVLDSKASHGQAIITELATNDLVPQETHCMTILHIDADVARGLWYRGGCVAHGGGHRPGFLHFHGMYIP
jgi:hypothetical protein